MTNQEYGQFCGLARAAEIVGQRWTLLILRDLSVGPRRYSDLVGGLPGIPTNTLASRLKELEEAGLVMRAAPAGGDRSVVYGLTPRGRSSVRRSTRSRAGAPAACARRARARSSPRHPSSPH
ncbi:hypothetical protein GCM10025881_16750 [Pseudolysinimonas kribbensis]|uniref:HTH hxlR-type domain-containing protein n=1 Tax=Pseudolysinimonas kribbensis TaxID=433641 RepID=A0ABQ6K7Y1_9MICO|nr:helix-turn-helix domain-containing protein [Pseudolysinimonas kribbensis]GMA94851.1 hypothetical protein GCM10025881_16750 [Pseudolysinimonas kribbensis]